MVVSVAAALLLVAGYALVDTIRTPPSQVRLMPRWVWQCTIAALPLVGAVVWYAAGRPTRVEIQHRFSLDRLVHHPLPYDSSVLRAPDDDDAWLANLVTRRADRPAETDPQG
ncbi:MAG TPA: PLDc N-terminal domain-containing protein [Dermatophilaceae bacterium]|nr:PLDc N-terminal domain-containing protein [Dermatophilaceae bacterium]